MTAVCSYCLARVRLRRDGTCWRHNRWIGDGPVTCSGSGRPPKPKSTQEQEPEPAADGAA